MKITPAYIRDVKELKTVTASATMGVGFLTSVCFFFCNIFGIECKMYAKKIEKAKSLAANALVKKAQSIKEASGIMNIRMEICETTIFMYGIIYA